MSEKDKVIKALKARRRNIRRRLREENNARDRMRYKSRHVRMASPIGARIGWFTDHLQELELIISFMEGKTGKKDFEHWLIDDSADSLCCLVGDTS